MVINEYSLGVPKTYFLEQICVVNTTEKYADVYVSDYNFDKVRKLKNISALRWIKAYDSIIRPGHGEGTLVIGEYTFNIDYAWGGRNKPGRPLEDRACYTLRLRSKDILSRMTEIADMIISFENGGKSTYEISTREWYDRLGWKNVKIYTKFLKDLNRDLKKSGRKPHNVKEFVKKFLRDRRKNLPMTFNHQMKRIETDML